MQIDGIQRYLYYKPRHGSAKKKNSRLIDIREVRGGFWVKACVHLDQGYLLLNECSSVFSDKKKK